MITDQERDSAGASSPATTPPPKTASGFQSEETARSGQGTKGGGTEEHLERIEHLLDEMRGLLDTLARARRHVEFSALRLIGSAVQALVIALLAWALSDWMFQVLAGTVLVKLAFAAVLQLMALTAFLMSRTDT